MGRPGKYSAEIHERAVRLVLDHQDGHESQWAAIVSIAQKLGCSREALRKWVWQAERDAGKRDGLSTEERARMKDLEREVRELRRANEILRKGGDRPPTEAMVRFIDEHRGQYGVEPICAVIPIAPSTYYEQKGREADPARVRRDEVLREQVQRVWAENLSIYGARKVWLQLKPEHCRVARCTVARSMASARPQRRCQGQEKPHCESCQCQG